MRKRERQEKLLSHLWSKLRENPFILIAINSLMEAREKHEGWLYEDELPDGYDYDRNFPKSKVVYGARMFPPS